MRLSVHYQAAYYQLVYDPKDNHIEVKGLLVHLLPRYTHVPYTCPSLVIE